MNIIKIRDAVPADALAISQLVRTVASWFTIHADGRGAEQFFASMTPEAIAGYISRPDFIYRKAIVDDKLAGVIALQGGSHLFHLFVAPEFQRRSVAAGLWRSARAAAVALGNNGAITVNSSLSAVPVYQRFGFHPTGEKVELHGIAFIPMQWDPKPDPK
jgi:GNAT superfamily N-acetyltransferase